MSEPETKQELRDEIDQLRKRVAELETDKSAGGDETAVLPVGEEQYAALFSHVDYPVTRLDRDGTILEINKVGAAMLKVTPDEAVGRSVYDFIPEAREGRSERLHHAFESGKTKRYEINVEGDADPHWFTSCYVPVRGVDGEVSSVLITSHDITDLKQAKGQRILLSSIVSQSSEGVALVDQDGIIEFINDAAARMHGYEASELLGKHVSVFHSKEQMAEVQVCIEEVQATGKFGGEIWHQHRDGHIFPTIMHNFMLYDDAGEPIGMVGTARDITELKQAEKQQTVLSSIVKQSSEGVALINMDHEIQYINDAFANMHGYEASELDGKHIGIFHTEEQMPAVLASIEQLQATGAFHGELWHKHRDGRVFPTIMHHSMLLDNDGEAYGMVGTARDITEQKLAEAELRESHEQYRLLIDNIGCPILLYDKRGTLLLTNDDGARMLGGVPADFIGKNMRDIVPERGARYMARHGRVIKTGEGQEQLDRIETPAGRRWIWSSGQPARKADGSIYGVQVIIRDVTDIKESEESLRVMANELKDERKTLSEKNIALKQILEHLEGQKQDWAQKLQASLERAISPFLDELARVAKPENASDIEELRDTLEAILGSDTDEFTRRYEGLTAREVEVCQSIAKGQSSKEIADKFNVSLLTVSKHREKIRKKLGLTGKRVDLGAYLHRHI